MKTVGELLKMLILELIEFEYKIAEISEVTYYNEYLGDSSIILSSILGEHLLGRKDWDVEKWLDDCLLTKVKFNDNGCYNIWGIMIWGKENTTQQWVDPFFFNIQLAEKKSNFSEYTFLFSEEGRKEITYEEFSGNRSLLDENFYLTEDWNPSERNWKFIIYSKNNLINPSVTAED